MNYPGWDETNGWVLYPVVGYTWQEWDHYPRLVCDDGTHCVTVIQGRLYIHGPSTESAMAHSASLEAIRAVIEAYTSPRTFTINGSGPDIMASEKKSLGRGDDFYIGGSGNSDFFVALCPTMRRRTGQS